MSATMSMTNIMRHTPGGTACGSLEELNMFENPWAPLLPQPAEAPNQLSKPAQTLRFLNFTNPDQSRSKSNRRLVRSVASKYSGRPLQAQKDKDKGKEKEKERGRREEREKEKEKEKEREKEKQTETPHKENATTAPKFLKEKEHTRASLTGVFSSDGVGHPFSKIRKQPSGRRNSLVVSPTKFKSASGDPFGVFPAKAAPKEIGLVSSCRLSRSECQVSR